MQNNLVSQAAQMQSGWIPNDMVSIINPISCLVLGPLFQHVLYPFLERRKISFEPILRITTGFVFMTIAMLYATLVQHIIYTWEPCYEHPGECAKMSELQGKAPSKVTVWIQCPVYVLVAVGELFACVTALEYACNHSPKSMEAIVQAINLLVAGIGSACAMGLTLMAKDPYIRLLYAFLACAMAATTLVFWWRFQTYDKLYAQERIDDVDPVISFQLHEEDK
jgi:POT family proton-dependent oligopeptide transporter